jgi:hypothetical protein
MFAKFPPRPAKRGFDLVSDALPFGRLWYTKPDDAVEYAKFFSRPRSQKNLPDESLRC